MIENHYYYLRFCWVFLVHCVNTGPLTTQHSRAHPSLPHDPVLTHPSTSYEYSPAPYTSRSSLKRLKRPKRTPSVAGTESAGGATGGLAAPFGEGAGTLGGGVASLDPELSCFSLSPSICSSLPASSCWPSQIRVKRYQD